MNPPRIRSARAILYDLCEHGLGGSGYIPAELLDEAEKAAGWPRGPAFPQDKANAAMADAKKKKNKKPDPFAL